jgi:hypothetical protein
MEFAKIIDYSERDTQIVIRKSTEHDEEDKFHYTIVLQSYKNYPDFLCEPTATLKYDTEEQRDIVFDSDTLEVRCKNVMNQAFLEMDNIINKNLTN